MSDILISKIDTDCTRISSKSNPLIRKANINRVFATVERMTGEVEAPIDVPLTPEETKDFLSLQSRITARIVSENGNHSG